MKQPKTNIGRLVLVATLVVLCSGCMSNAVRTNGIVAWNYRSIISTAPAHDHDQIPLSVHIGDFEQSPPSTDLGMPGGMLRLVPILSLASSPFEYVNGIPDEWGSRVDLRSGELEKILVEEISKSGLFKEVRSGGTGGDYKITGRVNLYFKMQRHFGGLGILYFGVLPMLLLPCDAEHFKCEAHFDVASAKSKIVVLSRDYVAESRWQLWPFYNQTRMWQCYGGEVFPKIVESFIADMRALPRSSWDK